MRNEHRLDRALQTAGLAVTALKNHTINETVLQSTFIHLLKIIILTWTPSSAPRTSRLAKNSDIHCNTVLVVSCLSRESQVKFDNIRWQVANIHCAITQRVMEAKNRWRRPYMVKSPIWRSAAWGASTFVECCLKKIANATRVTS